MKNKTVCPRCKKIYTEEPKLVSGPSLGSKVVDQPVCSSCFDKHHDLMKDFWQGVGPGGAQDCPACGTELTRQNGRPAYRRSDGGTVDLCVICESCHAKYRKLCASAAAK